MGQRRLTREQELELLDHYADPAVKVIMLCAEFGVSRAFASRCAARHGRDIRPVCMRKLTDEQETMLAACYARGTKVAIIGDEFGVHFSYPTRIAKRLGVPLRRSQQNRIAT